MTRDECGTPAWVGRPRPMQQETDMRHGLTAAALTAAAILATVPAQAQKTDKAITVVLA